MYTALLLNVTSIMTWVRLCSV